MSLFRVDPDNPFHGPHQGKPVSKAGVTAEEADAAMILVHGRGASAESMLLFADEFQHDGIHYRAIQADRHTWYPNSFLAPKEQNQPGISSGLQAIHDEIRSLNKAGIATNKIVLLGFSQGACLSSEFAARHPQRYGGLAILSGGLIGPEVSGDNYIGSFEGTPVFMGCSDYDPHIPQERVDKTAEILKALGADVTKKIYPGMGHTVNEDEIRHIDRLLDRLVKREKSE
ncbi:phospholipase [Balneolaceae bacterium YR4-1]|uniref:Phospholipase n=1 Tax=Halalkalibaculum roseum TaxID=2709311 RepID=A0A6M1SW52_9BACT|nr:alpha/beta hydrolase [Halalkalibaculum roseum]NGP75214.1 phospholipase [Halalkalibaculum roseum]